MSRLIALVLILLPLACATLSAAAEKKAEAPPAPAPVLIVYDVPVGFGREICRLAREEQGELVYHRGEAFAALSCPQYFLALQEILGTYAKPGATRADACWPLDPCSQPPREAAPGPKK